MQVADNSVYIEESREQALLKLPALRRALKKSLVGWEKDLYRAEIENLESLK